MPVSDADRAIWFMENLTLTEEYLGKPVVLRPWQKEIVRGIHAQNEDGSPKIRQALLMLPRKCGKTEYAAFESLYHTYATGKTGQSCILAASSIKQASKTFDKLLKIVKADPFLRKQSRILASKKFIEVPHLGNTLEVISSDGNDAHGGNPSLVVLDELHVFGDSRKGRALYDALATSFGARSNYLFLIISTQANSRTSLMYQEYEYAKCVKDGTIDDPTYFSYLCEAPSGSDWTKEETWFQAMPALGDFLELDYIQRQFLKTKDNPAKESAFRQYHLNELVAGVSKFVSHEKWLACAALPVPSDDQLKGQPCFGGLDLSSIEDYTAFVLVFRTEEGTLVVKPYFWLPRKRAEELAAKGDRRHLEWADKGYVHLTEGETVDYTAIQAKIIELSEIYDIQLLLADVWNANHLCLQLRSEGIKVNFLQQSARGLNAPTKILQKSIIDVTLAHGNHPVLNWMADNVGTKVDSHENIWLTKAAGREGKIDGMSAMVSAIAGSVASAMNIQDCFITGFDTSATT